VALLERQGLRERSSLSSSQRIVAEALVGNTGMARDLAARLLAREKPTPESLIDVGLGLVIAGDVERGARSIDAGLSKVPKGTADLDRSASMLHAAVELGRRRPAQALALLDPLEPMAPKDGKVFGSMLIRGDALRLLGRHADAEAQYQKLLDSRSLSPFDVALPLAHLGVADARARAGDVKGAREAYEAFFEMWKDADPDVPLLRKARVAYEKLSST
jgi:tetratricopeptide (TPR) repeat protein